MPRSANSIRAGVALALLTSFVAACSSSPATTSSAASPTSASSSIKTITPGVLTIATYGSDPPLITVGPGANQLGGLSGDWINAFAAEFGLKVKLFQTTFASTLTAVQQGKADIGAPVYYTSSRAQLYYYTYPVDVESLVVFTKSSFHYTGPSSLLGHKVGSVTGYAWTPYFQKYFGSDFLVYPTAKDAQTAFVNGQIDAYLDADINYFSPPMSLSPTISVHPVHAGDFGIPSDLVSSESYWIVRCNEQGLANALDVARQKLVAKWASLLSGDGAPAGYPQLTPSLVKPAEAC
jgi:ABC-type amino acid transport substrate-binding protein